MTKNKMNSNWQIKKLGEICNFIGGGTPSKTIPNYWNGDIPWASIKDIKGQYLTKTSDFITSEGLKKSATNLALPNEIILATRINPGRPIISKISTSINQDLKIVRPKIEIYNLFLYYLLLNKENNIIKLSNGTTVLGITLNSLNDIEIQLPPLETQQAIVSKIEELFSELDQGIEDLKTAQQQLKTYRQSVLKWAFEGKLTNDNVRDGELPERWEMLKIKDICEIKGGKNQSKVINPNGKYPIYGSSGIFGYADEYICDENTTIVGRKGNINSPLFVTTKFWNVDTAFGLCVNNKYDSKLLFYFCLGFNFKKLDKSTTIPSLAKSDILSIDIQVPPIEEQNLIVQEIESRLSVADKMEECITQSLQQAEALRQSILKKAFSGELV
jgi:restriction endonuclease S subunit